MQRRCQRDVSCMKAATVAVTLWGLWDLWDPWEPPWRRRGFTSKAFAAIGRKGHKGGSHKGGD
ncbi:hypothetical protein QE438_000347 [Pseudoxanthomonas sp. SORGH_AS 997]|uniref:Uncharacterized protein n=1 Tax=Pseudoxanthomonas winnipegensis TaxID=2480810 RepID=A0AAW8GBL3_9GAMM|nr:hypothetical protein [Pseudoxanthomonas winnipegensis]MDQ1132952.1 hypothetical protein [Pseudoxanthomonas winnipegensis]MDR6137043.1 hypothetical protein [Pseudoxanthomonas sp. SORGH_AS_0997]